MSIHWTQEQATVYPVVVLRKVDDILHEDHFTFISNDLTHDVPFVELCNSMIHTYYDERDINIEMDIEFNDGCASSINACKQFKVLQGEIFHPFGYILKPVMGGANLTALGVLLKDLQAERLLLLIQLYETQLNCVSFAMSN